MLFSRELMELQMWIWPVEHSFFLLSSYMNQDGSSRNSSVLICITNSHSHTHLILVSDWLDKRCYDLALGIFLVLISVIYVHLCSGLAVSIQIYKAKWSSHNYRGNG